MPTLINPAFWVTMPLLVVWFFTPYGAIPVVLWFANYVSLPLLARPGLRRAFNEDKHLRARLTAEQHAYLVRHAPFYAGPSNAMHWAVTATRLSGLLLVLGVVFGFQSRWWELLPVVVCFSMLFKIGSEWNHPFLAARRALDAMQRGMPSPEARELEWHQAIIAALEERSNNSNEDVAYPGGPGDKLEGNTQSG